ncbi:MAG TPA: trigger factor [Roseiflexaceae bacterium]|nr:trigger factor [Roseiflexaceae bacterium]
MKVTTEKLPKSLLALNIELDREQVEKGLDRAARRLSQKVNVPGFRKGKAPRFILENYFGRDALVEEATDDLVNKAFREVLEQQQIEPFGPASLEGPPSFDQEPYHFRVLVPVAPTTTLPDYRALRAPLNVEEVTDETLDRAMEALRDRHVVLREPEEPRPAQEGDQLAVELESFVDGEPLDDRDESGAVRESTLVMEPDRVVTGLYEGLLGIQPDETREINVQMPDDHANDKVAGKEVQFKVKLLRIQERLLPDWEELPVLEEFEGTLDELRAKTRKELEEAARENAARETTDSFIKQVVEQSQYDIPDALIEREADELLHRQGHEFERYGISLEQMLQYRGKTHDEAVEELKPQAEEQLKTTLALREVMRAESLEVDDAEVEAEVERLLNTYEEELRERARALLSTQLRPTVASSVLDKKLRERLVAIAIGEAPALEPAPEPSSEAVEVAATGETDEQ